MLILSGQWWWWLVLLLLSFLFFFSFTLNYNCMMEINWFFLLCAVFFFLLISHYWKWFHQWKKNLINNDNETSFWFIFFCLWNSVYTTFQQVFYPNARDTEREQIYMITIMTSSDFFFIWLLLNPETNIYNENRTKKNENNKCVWKCMAQKNKWIGNLLFAHII